VRKPKAKKWTEAEIRALPDDQLVGLSLNPAHPEEVQQLAVMHVRARQVKDRASIQPIDHAVIAEPHTPIYRMHRYYARRPWSVFNELILHYSNPGDIILDPFCGGGVTVVEGVRLGRKVIGVDMNPLATFITRMECSKVDRGDLARGLGLLRESVGKEIDALYQTRCPNCGKVAIGEWFQHSAVAECEQCRRPVVLAHAEKLRAKTLGAAGAGYRCPNCGDVGRPPQDRRQQEVMIALHYVCPHCSTQGHKGSDSEDETLYESLRQELEHRANSLGLHLPEAPIPDGDLQRDHALYAKGVRKFRHLFTARNLLANALLKRGLQELTLAPQAQRALVFAFSASLQYTNRMVRYVESRWRQATEWATHSYWLPDVDLEQNVWSAFVDRYKWVERGAIWADEHLPAARLETHEFEALMARGTHWLITGSSHALPIADSTVDAIITDPPYGGNVQYAELCDFWTVWLEDMGVLDHNVLASGLIDNRNEAIQTRHDGFPSAKSLNHYRQMLFEIFKECRRVLKPGHSMVMTFHNRDFMVWNAIHAAAHDAGFVVPERDGVIYQPPIKLYSQTIHTRAAGSLRGDFVVTFKRADVIPKRRIIPQVEIGSKVRKVAQETIAYHGSASLSTIYMRLIPFLVNGGLLDKVNEKDIVQFLTDDFETRTDKEGNERWYFKEAAEPRPVTPLDFVPVPVEARIEYVIRSLLRRNRHATQDEILNMVYSQLINGNAAEYQEIQRVLQRICVLRPVAGKTRQAYVLREKAEEQQLLDLFAGQQPGLAEQQLGARAESEHDLIIEDLALLGIARDCQIHIGRSEQGKYVRFKQWSKPMTYPPEFGIHPDAFDKITQIDTLWLRGQAILSAFEVEKSTTIDSGINRFRELFAALPNLTVPAYLVVPDSREEETRGKLGSLANRRDSLTTKVRYLVFSDIMGKSNVNLESVARQVA